MEQHHSSQEISSVDNGNVTTYLKNEQNKKLISKVNRMFWIGLGCWTTYNLIDTGLSRFFALETLTHGTGPLGYIGINLNGADPSFGGGATGSSIATENIRNSENFFHVFKDSDFPNDCELPFGCTWLGNKIYPRVHAVLSGLANFGCSMYGWPEKTVKMSLGAVSGFLTPTLKFRFTPDEILNCTDSCRFEIDPDYMRTALRTSKPISPIHLGITGSLSQGINTDMFNRMYANPEKVLLGIALLTTAAVVAKKTYQYYVNSTSERQLNASEKQTTSVKSSEEKISFFQNFRKKIKPMAVNSCWATLALTTIFLNTI